MPKYNYKCSKCGYIFSKIILYKDRNKKMFCDKCNNICQKLLSIPLDVEVFEIADSFKNKHIKRNINQIMKKRSAKHREQGD